MSVGHPIRNLEKQVSLRDIIMESLLDVRSRVTLFYRNYIQRAEC